MNEEKKDELLNSFENPTEATTYVDPTPDIAPVMPETSKVNDVEINMIAPEFQAAMEPTPVVEAPLVEPQPPVMEQPPVVEAPVVEMPVAQTPAVEAPVMEPTPVVESNDENLNPALQSATDKGVNPSLLKDNKVVENNIKEVSEESLEDKPTSPKEFKKNLIFIAIIFVVVMAFILFLPKIMQILS